MVCGLLFERFFCYFMFSWVICLIWYFEPFGLLFCLLERWSPALA